MNLIKPMIIKMKNGAHTNNLFFGRTIEQTTWNPRKYWFPFIIQKWRFSLSLILTCLLNGTHLLCVDYTLYMKIDKLILLLSIYLYFFFFFSIVLKFFFCYLSPLSLIEHFSFWQWKKPFKEKKWDGESQSLHLWVRCGAMMMMMLMSCVYYMWADGNQRIFVVYTLAAQWFERNMLFSCCLGIFVLNLLRSFSSLK